MAANYSDLVIGTEMTWKSSGGTKVLTLTSLTNGSCREGDKSATLIDGSKGMPELLVCRLESAVGSAATTGRELALFFGESDSATAGTNNPGNLTGADAGLSTPTELLMQLFNCGSLVFSNTRGTNVQKAVLFYWPKSPYIIPVLYNDTGQTLSGTAGNHVLSVTPYYRRTPIA